MITDHAANDGRPSSSRSSLPRGRPFDLACSSTSSVMISEARRRRSTTCDQSRSAEATGRQGRSSGTIDPKRLVPLLGRHVVFELGDRLRQLSVVLGEHRDVVSAAGCSIDSVPS